MGGFHGVEDVKDPLEVHSFRMVWRFVQWVPWIPWDPGAHGPKLCDGPSGFPGAIDFPKEHICLLATSPALTNVSCATPDLRCCKQRRLNPPERTDDLFSFSYVMILLITLHIHCYCAKCAAQLWTAANPNFPKLQESGRRRFLTRPKAIMESWVVPESLCESNCTTVVMHKFRIRVINVYGIAIWAALHPFDKSVEGFEELARKPDPDPTRPNRLEKRNECIFIRENKDATGIPYTFLLT